MYKPIDQQRTGQKLKIMMKLAGYDEYRRQSFMFRLIT